MIHDLAKFIFYYKELEYELDMINYSYSNKIIKHNSSIYQLNHNLTQVSNIIQHFLNASDIKINNKIKSNLELVKLIGGKIDENVSIVIQYFLNASDIKINNKINKNLKLVKQIDTRYIKAIDSDYVKLNKFYKTA